MNISLLFAILLTNFGCCQMQGSSCDLSAIQKCLEPIKFSNAGPLAEALTDAQISQICGNVPQATTCYKQQSINCTEYDLINFSGQFDSVIYVCGDGRNGLKGMQACFADTNYMQSFSTCFSSLTSLSNSLDFNITGNNCKLNNAMLGCYVNASKVCNSEGFVTNFYKKMIGKSLNLYYGCILDPINWNTKVYSQCNTFKLNQCIQNFDFSILSYLTIAKQTSDDFNRNCGTIGNAVACVTNDAKCDETIPSIVSPLSSAKGILYLCNTDRTGYDMLSKCVMNSQSSFSACVTFENDCASQNSAFKCLVDTAKTKCGNSTTMQNYYYKITQPVLDLDGCKLNLPNSAVNKGGKEIGKDMFTFLFILFSYVVFNK